MTLDDLEWQNALLRKKSLFTEPTRKILIKTDPYYQRQNVGLFSRNVRYMRIFVGVPRGGAGFRNPQGHRVVLPVIARVLSPYSVMSNVSFIIRKCSWTRTDASRGKF